MATAPLVGLEAYLYEKLEETHGNFDSDEPHLGIAGDSRLGRRPDGFFLGPPITPDDFVRFSEGTKVLGSYASTRELIEIVRLNYADYDRMTDRFANEYKVDHVIGWDRVTEMVTEANRQVLNFLTAMRTFLDHIETRLKRDFTDTSPEVVAFKRITAT